MIRRSNALFNVQNGGLEEGRYDFEPLKAELAEGPRVPARRPGLLAPDAPAPGVRRCDHRMLTWKFEF